MSSALLRPSKSRSRLALVLIGLCFLAPILIALAFQSPLLRFSPAPSKNLGELIHPVQPIEATAFQTLLDIPPGPREANWSLVYLPPAGCGACTAELDLLAHIRQAMGRELDRVQLEIISDRRFELPKEAAFTVRLAAADQQQALLARLGLKDGGLVILDPLRNAMMRYPSQFDGSKVRKDLARLLKASQVGKSQSSGVIAALSIMNAGQKS